MCAPRPSSVAAGSASSETVITRSTSRKSPRSSGASGSASESVGSRARAAGRRSRTSGRASRETVSTSASVGCSSRSVVGRMRTVSASSAFRRAVAPRSTSSERTSPESWPWRRPSDSKTWPLSEISRRTARCWLSSTRTRSPASSANGDRLPSAAFTSSPRPANARAVPFRNRWRSSRVGLSSARRISSSSTVGRTWVAGSSASSGRSPLSSVARRQLDVGLAEERLQPQRRPRVLRDRRVRGVDLDLDARRGLDLLGLLHVAHGHARDAHVGVVGELGGLLEVRLEAVALRGDRRRAPERRPEVVRGSGSTTARTPRSSRAVPAVGACFCISPSSAVWTEAAASRGRCRPRRSERAPGWC